MCLCSGTASSVKRASEHLPSASLAGSVSPTESTAFSWEAVRLSATVWRQHWERLLSFPAALTGWGQHLGGLVRTLTVMKSEPFADLVWVQLNFSQLSTDARWVWIGTEAGKHQDLYKCHARKEQR